MLILRAESAEGHVSTIQVRKPFNQSISPNEKQPFANQTCFEFPRKLSKHDASPFDKHHVWFRSLRRASSSLTSLGGLKSFISLTNVCAPRSNIR
ncbi:MAG: hypothetical protein ACTS7I_00330 [Candidatus Hodgkinia cicadicola]